MDGFNPVDLYIPSNPFHSMANTIIPAVVIFSAAVGIALLFWHEYQASTASLEQVLLGVALTFGGIISASIANVMQAGERLKSYPLITVLAWAMLWGAVINIILSWALVGPPTYETRAAYWLGIVYLGVIGSVVTFPLYFSIIREIGPGKAAYSSVLVPVVEDYIGFDRGIFAILTARGRGHPLAQQFLKCLAS